MNAKEVALVAIFPSIMVVATLLGQVLNTAFPMLRPGASVMMVLYSTLMAVNYYLFQNTFGRLTAVGAIFGILLIPMNSYVAPYFLPKVLITTSTFFICDIYMKAVGTRINSRIWMTVGVILMTAILTPLFTNIAYYFVLPRVFELRMAMLPLLTVIGVVSSAVGAEFGRQINGRLVPIA